MLTMKARSFASFFLISFVFQAILFFYVSLSTTKQIPSKAPVTMSKSDDVAVSYQESCNEKVLLEELEQEEEIEIVPPLQYQWKWGKPNLVRCKCSKFKICDLSTVFSPPDLM